MVGSIRGDSLVHVLELANFLAMIYASAIPYYIAYKVPPERRSFAYLSIVFGLMLTSHSIHHFGGFFENDLIQDAFGLASAVLAVALGLVYSYIKRKVA